MIIQISVFAISMIIMASVMLIGLIIWMSYAGYQSHLNKLEDSQTQISDKKLLLLINEQPDKLLSVKDLMTSTGMTKSQAKSRLNFLLYQGLLKNYYTSRLKYYYTLITPIGEIHEDINFSDTPFLTIEDLLKVFEAHEYLISLQNICLCTGLPTTVIKRELKFFEEEKVIEKVLNANAYGSNSFWKLREPYRSNPELLKKKAGDFDLKLDALLRKEKLGRA